MRAPLVFTLAVLFCSLLSAQSPMYRRLSFPVTQDGKSLRYPFAGGLNAGQLSAADLNQDGIQDLVIFDRAGDVFLTFLNGGKAGETDYTYAPDYACFFPKLYDYVLLRDFDGDGAADIFTASDEPGSQEVEVYKGYFENKALKFKQFYFSYPATCTNCNPLHIYYPGINPSFWNNLPIVNTDYPDVDDIDGDGDLDILTFAATVGGNIWWLRNTSVESGWGRFYESGQIRCKNSLSNNSATCADSLTGRVTEDRGGDPTRHPGSTVMTYDQNGDGVKEVVLGDVSFDCLNMMTNGGTPTHAWMIAQDTAFPQYDEPVDLPVFPVAFYLDIDNDNRRDMVVAPNVKTLSEDIRCLWWYKNIGSATNHIFELQTKSLFVNDMIDIGYGSRPAVADVNGDGLLDIVVGNYGYYQNSKGTYASLYLYLNVGSAEAPRYALTDRNWLNMADFAPDSDYDFAPTFGDIDGDLDLDLIVGSNLGWLYCYRNAAGLGNPMILERDFDPMWQEIEIGIASTPVIFDLDGDGRNDILSGGRKGSLSYLRNIGPSVTEPRFAPNPTNKNLGSVNTLQLGDSFGWSTPSILPTPTGGAQLVMGSSKGNLMVYSNLSAASGAVFTKTDNALGNVYEGYRTHPVFADLDSDGLLEVLLGNQRGGLSVFRTELKDCTTSVKTAVAAAAPLRISPNPARHWVRAELPTDAPTRWRAIDALGREIANGNAPGGLLNLSVADWPAGIYVLEAVAEGRHAVGKVVKQ